MPGKRLVREAPKMLRVRALWPVDNTLNECLLFTVVERHLGYPRKKD